MTASSSAVSFSFMRRHPAHWLALAGGAGLAPFAAGTFGTLWAWGVWWLLLAGRSPGVQAGVIVAAFALGVWACRVTARHLGQADPGAIVCDEVAAFWLVLWLLPARWGGLGQAAAFALFRFFDAAKPGPVRWADELFHEAGGWRGALGIMFDDAVAAFCTLLTLALLVRLVG